MRRRENGRLTVNVDVVGTNKTLQRQIARKNSFVPEQLDMWRQYISGIAPGTGPKSQE